MYRGNNVTAIQSQRWLGEALIDLMKEKAYSAITIADICKRADLSRQTFYNVVPLFRNYAKWCTGTVIGVLDPTRQTHFHRKNGGFDY